MEPQELVSKAVRHLLIERGKNQADLAAGIGMTEATVSRKLNNIGRWDVNELHQLGLFFGVNFLVDPAETLASVLSLVGVNGREHTAVEGQPSPVPEVGLPLPRTRFLAVAA
jgi:transcriptional regulator with XRE-family HTH domain